MKKVLVIPWLNYLFDIQACQMHFFQWITTKMSMTHLVQCKDLQTLKNCIESIVLSEPCPLQDRLAHILFHTRSTMWDQQWGNKETAAWILFCCRQHQWVDLDHDHDSWRKAWKALSTRQQSHGIRSSKNNCFSTLLFMKKIANYV